jgi:hypothetical protein
LLNVEDWIELRGMWSKNIVNLDAREIAEARRILRKYELRVTDIASPLFKCAWRDIEQWPYVQQWHLDLQRDLIQHAVATIAYVGAKGTHLTATREQNSLHVISASENPFLPGQPITADICNTQGGGP